MNYLRPSVRKIRMYCGPCKYNSSIYFMTVKEIYNKTTIKQQCGVCEEITIFYPIQEKEVVIPNE